jgi:GT2 family glycosyltransferase
LDGVWFCLRRELFEKIRFDEATFSGFHFYDVDITLQVHFLNYKLLVVRDILIHHQSIGILDRQWVNNAALFYKKWKDRLPVSVRPYPLDEQCLMEYRVLHEMMTTKIQNQYDEPSVYREGLRQLLQFRKGWRYHKTPVWAARLMGRYISSLFS